MAKHLVRWNYSANTLLNRQDEDSAWYEQEHPNKDAAVDHYIRLLTSGVEGLNVECYRLTRLKPQ
jgi:hypothetical protein